MRSRSALAITSALVLACLGIGARISRADWQEPPVPLASGAELFTQNCVACHGPRGDGDGPAAVSLNPKPRQLSNKALMTKISDDTIFNTVRKGGAAMGKSALMPPFAQFDDAQIKSLIAHIRSLCGCQFEK